MTPRMSVRARAREIYSEMAQASLGYAGQAPSSLGSGGQGEAGLSSGLAENSADQGSKPRESAAALASLRYARQAPTPDPSPLLARASGGGEKKARTRDEQEATGAEEVQRPSLAQPDLTAKVRDLYEKSAVPVREIARLVCVTERMIYRYVERGGWKRRYKCLTRDEAVAAANRGRRWQVGPERADITPAKGSGGRFIRREDIGKPYPTGLKALDPHGRAKALAVCGKAKKLSRKAQAEARKEARFEVFLEVLAVNTRCFSDLAAYRRRLGPRPSPFQLRIGMLLANTVEQSIRHVEVLLPDLAAMFRVGRRASHP